MPKTPLNEKKRWNEIAPTYNDEIFDVFQSDKWGVLPRYFKKHWNKNHIAIDFGCGNGKALRFLAPYFKHVYGADISQGLLDQAAKLGYENVTLLQKDLAVPSLKMKKADFLFCCNVAILSDVALNNRLIKNASKVLKPRGTALFVIPSIESVLFSSWRLIDWYKREGVEANEIEDDEISGFRPKKHEIIQGLININGVLTKHYTAPEIDVVFSKAGFTITSIDRVEYDWNSEFASPPSWMKEPYPWDWLVECTI